MKNLKLSQSLVNKLISKADVKCTKSAEKLLSKSIVISVAFLSMCIDELSDENCKEEDVLQEVLVALGVPVTHNDVPSLSQKY
ncbi:uncharacterized protein Eint_100295 [Encephalitozoon intestinalis ATCC 50506]|uniref:Uncharacterized protein n=1 Tax=Encephalitozoon intestinalis (strain ATCC 50506) TaxID=876142 RepID=W8PGU6_ENCIT|nr:uncharacterized protein Eint_100295 [Encephalitozoon intestinalis ATCC 50506]AHL30156.1 hypothetical protein Eint_100295 [Encephalitozoon intestinalis ATCC 50506]UTX46187.1 hypothetical protein GPK93_10g17840 [Encephalitozoon intestinalis]